MGLLASLLALVGCDNAVKTQSVYGTGADSWQLLQAASPGGALALETFGDGIGAAPGDFKGRALAALRANFSDPWLGFETDRAKTQNEYRLVLVAGARSVRQPDFAQICAGRPPRSERDPQNLNLHAVLCGPAGPVTASHGWLKRPQDAANPAIDRLIVQTSLSALRGRT